MSKVFNTFINIVHTHADTSFSFEFEDLHFFFFTLSISENNLESSWFVNNKISSSILISKSVSSDNNGFFPSWNKSWDIVDDDRFSKDGTIENVSNGSIGTFPHLFKFEFFDSCFVRCDGGTFNSYFTLFDSIGGIDGNLINCSISMLNTEIKIFDIKI